MFGGKSFKDLLIASTKRGDIFFALAIILMLVILIMPMPAWLLDIALAFSITISCLVLMTAIFIERPNEFNAFPLVLPKMSPLNPQYLTKKQSVFQKIVAFIEKFKDIGGQI